MIRRLLQISIRVVYTLTWPLSALYLHNSHRVRVLATKGDELLLIKSSYGTQRWELPGGGIEAGESSLAAAKRELREETNIAAKKSELQYIGSKRISHTKFNWPMINIDFYYYNCKKSTAKIIRPTEIVGLAWYKKTNLPDDISQCVAIAQGLTVNKI